MQASKIVSSDDELADIDNALRASKYKDSSYKKERIMCCGPIYTRIMEPI